MEFQKKYVDKGKVGNLFFASYLDNNMTKPLVEVSIYSIQNIENLKEKVNLFYQSKQK